MITHQSELAVNKTKVAEVRAWFDEAAPTPDPTRPPSKLQKYRRILALSGPSGVGKTATVRALASELGLEVVEWVEGAEENGIGGDFGQSLVATILCSSSARPQHGGSVRILLLTHLAYSPPIVWRYFRCRVARLAVHVVPLSRVRTDALVRIGLVPVRF